MSVRGLARLLAVYAVVLVLACIAVHHHASLTELAPAAQRIVVSRYLDGQRVERTATAPGEQPSTTPSVSPAGITVHEAVVAEGPMTLDRWKITFGLVPARDGVYAELGDKTAWVTADDLIAAEAYDHAGAFLDPSLGIGTHYATVLHLLATQLGVMPAEVERSARVKRVRFERRTAGEPESPRITIESLDRERVRLAIRDAAQFLARSVDDSGRFRYILDAVTGKVLTGYSWPRHAGATYFLAQAAALLDDATIRFACLRAAAHMRDDMMHDCGENKCIADEDEADVGSSALGLLAFTEIVRTGADPSYRRASMELARFLRSQQRPDGELMHIYDRRAKKPVDVQLLYFTGEAALALARAHAELGNPEDLTAATRALARLSGDGWSFFGSRYYFTEEHWTCQAVAELWDRAPDPRALAFCLRWHEYQRRLQYDGGDSPFDAAGAFGFGPFVTPRVTPASSRGEAAGAALYVMKRDPNAATTDPVEHARTVALLDEELGRALAFVMRAQLRPGPRHLFAHAAEVNGGIPGSAVDLQLRIDYVQHAGSMMIRWLELHGEAAR